MTNFFKKKKKNDETFAILRVTMNIMSKITMDLFSHLCEE